MKPQALGWPLTVLFLANLVASIDRTALAALLPAIKQDMTLSDTQLGILTGIAFSAFYAIFGLPLAALADRGHRPRLIAAALVFWSLMTAATGLAKAFVHLVAARMMVAVGEAGGVPASHSLLSDLTPDHRRPAVLAIHTAAGPLGSLLGLAGGGLLAATLGWRDAFVVLGLVGLPVAVLTFFLREPRTAGARADGIEPRPKAGTLLGRRSFQLLLGGFALGSFAMNGLLQWLPSYLGRAFEMDIARVGVQFGLAYGLGAMAGMLAGGAVAGPLMRRDTGWALRLASISYLVGAPCLLASLLAPSAPIALALIFLGSASASAAYGPAFAMIQIIAEPRLRAFATASSLLVSNLVGAGLGPLAVGILSDSHGGAPAHALRFALVSLFPVLISPALLYWLAMKRLAWETR
ncbi:MFS transporter [Phenylobacterium sp.]|uniref:spinster family MFS transporter n=1 Tax=Phenylobacterium sp. TaxID=1871053 RepID=UPI00301E40E8